MEKESKTEASKVIILSDYEKVEAEEYVEDADHVYRKKDEAFKGFKFKSSLFWLRLTCFFGLLAMAIILILRIVKLLFSIVFSAFQHFKDKLLNKQIKGCWQDLKNAGKVCIGLAVGVINPNWGMRLMSLFFSITGRSTSEPFFHNLFRFSSF